MTKTNIERLEKQLKGDTEEVTYTKDQWWSLKYGDSKLMVLPPFSEDSDISEIYYIHYLTIRSADGKEKVRAYQCIGKECPVCEKSKQLIESSGKTGNENDKQLGYDIKARKVVLYNVLNGNLEHKILAAKQSQQVEIDAEIVSSYRNNGVDITNLDTARFLNVQRFKNEPYCRARVIDREIPFTQEQKNTILKSLRNLKEVYITNTPDELKQALDGIDVNAIKFKKEREAAKVEEAPVITTVKQEVPKVEVKTEVKQEIKKEESKVESKTKEMTLEDIKKLLNG